MKYILVYAINDFADCGGGLFYNDFKSEDDLKKAIVQYSQHEGEKFELVCAGRLCPELVVTPIKYAIEYKFDTK